MSETPLQPAGPVVGQLSAYRDAVADLVDEVVAYAGGADQGEHALKILESRAEEEELASVLSSVDGGIDATVEGLRAELSRVRAHHAGSPHDTSSLVRIYLLSQIDAVWWGSAPTFEHDDDVEASHDLADLAALRATGRLQFTYCRQPKGLPGRVRDRALRQLLPNRRPVTAGLKFVRVRRPLVSFLNELAGELAEASPDGTPPLWVTSLVRSVEHQHHLRELGYVAMLPSAHCSGYAADVEMAWLDRFGAREVLARLLLERQERGQANVIDEGQVWHVCLSPGTSASLRQAAQESR